MVCPSNMHAVCGNSRYHWPDASDLGAHTHFLLSLLKWKVCVQSDPLTTNLSALSSLLTMCPRRHFSPPSFLLVSFGGKEEAQEHRQELESEQSSRGHEDTKSILNELAHDTERQRP